MTHCPKCGSYEISGPRYRRQEWGLEHPEALWYRCIRCGYEESRPTLDTPKAEGREPER